MRAFLWLDVRPMNTWRVASAWSSSRRTSSDSPWRVVGVGPIGYTEDPYLVDGFGPDAFGFAQLAYFLGGQALGVESQPKPVVKLDARNIPTVHAIDAEIAFDLGLGPGPTVEHLVHSLHRFGEMLRTVHRVHAGKVVWATESWQPAVPKTHGRGSPPVMHGFAGSRVVIHRDDWLSRAFGDARVKALPVRGRAR
jgi:hypothetical protein